MNMLGTIPEAVRTTLQTFEKLIQSDEKRRRELEAEIAALHLRQRVIGASQDASWITRCFIEPRSAELKCVESRLALVSEKLTRLRDEWSKSRPVSQPQPQPQPAAQRPVERVLQWIESGTPSVICLAV